jgi:hypothetical protein
MSKFDEAIEQYKGVFDTLGVGFDSDLLQKVTKGLGPSIYNKDSSLVAGTDPEELARVKNNFLIKKLGMTDSADLDKAIADIIGQMKPVRMKPRAVVYYLLVKKFGKESFYA